MHFVFQKIIDCFRNNPRNQEIRSEIAKINQKVDQ